MNNSDTLSDLVELLSRVEDGALEELRDSMGFAELDSFTEVRSEQEAQVWIKELASLIVGADKVGAAVQALIEVIPELQYFVGESPPLAFLRAEFLRRPTGMFSYSLSRLSSSVREQYFDLACCARLPKLDADPM